MDSRKFIGSPTYSWPKKFTRMRGHGAAGMLFFQFMHTLRGFAQRWRSGRLISFTRTALVVDKWLFNCTPAFCVLETSPHWQGFILDCSAHDLLLHLSRTFFLVWRWILNILQMMVQFIQVFIYLFFNYKKKWIKDLGNGIR